jgi:hypothetical protein
MQHSKTQHIADNCYAECHIQGFNAECHLLSVIMLSVIMLNVVMLNVMPPLGDLGPMFQNFFVSNFRISEIALSVFPWEAFPA